MNSSRRIPPRTNTFIQPRTISVSGSKPAKVTKPAKEGKAGGKSGGTAAGGGRKRGPKAGEAPKPVPGLPDATPAAHGPQDQAPSTHPPAVQAAPKQAEPEVDDDSAVFEGAFGDPAGGPPAKQPQANPAVPIRTQPHAAATAPQSDNESAGGMSFIRMISDVGFVRAIPTALVCDKLSQGWQFIVDEPVFPREGCAPSHLNLCELSGTQGFYPRPRHHERPLTELDAGRVWLGQMYEDRIKYAGRTDLDFRVFDAQLRAVQGAGAVGIPGVGASPFGAPAHP